MCDNRQKIEIITIEDLYKNISLLTEQDIKVTLDYLRADLLRWKITGKEVTPHMKIKLMLTAQPIKQPVI
jgi:hypothetical protein